MSKKVLHFDLKSDARRSHLLKTVLNELTLEERSLVEQAVSNLVLEKNHHHNFAEVAESLDALEISSKVKLDMLAIYKILAYAEAQVHGCSIEDTHFHEVGKKEAILNAAKICIAIDILLPKTITATCVQTGSGTIQCSHGILAIPAPATSAILDQEIPICAEKLEGELCTPTSAAIIKHFVNKYILQ